MPYRKDTIRSDYRMVYRPNHPLVFNSPYLPEHRVILYDKVGPGTHPCFYCKRLLTWMPGKGSHKDAIVTDHIDRDKHNNNPHNIVVSCQTCNVMNREYTVRDDEVFIVRKNGTRLRGEYRSCKYCDELFVATPDPRPNRGQYCSMSCARSVSR